jgi:hypothetical protein
MTPLVPIGGGGNHPVANREWLRPPLWAIEGG